MPRRILVIIVLLLSMVLTVSAQMSDALQEQITSAENHAETLRGLALLEPITLEFPTRDDLREYLSTALEEELPPEVAEYEMLFYVAFGFLPADYDLRGELLELYVQQVGGFYDSETETMNVILMSGEQPDEFLPLLERIVYVHEYVHAIQDQHFDLDALLEELDADDDSDQFLAHLALVEGDATTVMNAYTQALAEANPIGTLMQLGMSLAQGANLTLPIGTPAIFEAELLFPYEQGAVFVQELYQQTGSWDAVNASYSNPPLTTEHIYHPDRYLAGEMPLTIDLSDASSVLGADWSLARAGSMGEFYLREYLAQQLANGSVHQAATGWNGDRYHIYQAADESLAWQWSLAWDTALDAEQFEANMRTFADLTYGMDNVSVNADVICWTGDTASLCAAFSETETVLTVAPTLEQAQALQQ